MLRFAKASLTTIALTTVALAAITGRRAQSADTDLRPVIQEMRDEVRELRPDVKALREILERREATSPQKDEFRTGYAKVKEYKKRDEKARMQDAISHVGNASEAENKLQGALERPVTVDWAYLPLGQFLDSLLRNLDIKIDVLDEHGSDTSLPVTVHATNVPLKTVLKLALEQVHLVYSLHDGALHISRDHAAEGLEVRSHAVGVLFEVGRESPPADIIDFKSLETYIQAAIEPGSWTGSGGPGRIGHNEAKGWLVVYQTPRIHQQVVALLRDLARPTRPSHVTFRAAMLDDRAEQMVDAQIKLQTVNGRAATVLTKAQSDFLLRIANAVGVLERLPAVTVALGGETSIRPDAGKNIWPQEIQIHTGQIGGRPDVWFDLAGNDPTTGLPRRASATAISPDLKPLLIEMQMPPAAREWKSPWGPTRTVDQLIGKPPERRFLLIDPEIEAAKKPREEEAK